RLRKLANHGQLVAKILVKNFKVGRQRDSGLTIVIGGDVAIVDIEHVRGLDEGVAEGLIFPVGRVGKHEPTATFEKSAANEKVFGDSDIAIEEAGKAGG